MNGRRRAIGDGQQGYVLLALLVTASILLAGLALAIPRMAQQSQRVKDERLIERGEQYRRAIELYYRDHNKYPADLDDLEDTDGVRYLRRRYADPVGETGEWRLIHMGIDGRFEDSLLFDTGRDRRAGALGRSQGSGLGTSLAGPFGSQAVPRASAPPRGVRSAPDPRGGFIQQAPGPPERFQARRESAAPDLANRTRYNQGFGFDAAEGAADPEPGEPPDYSRMLPSQVPMDENERRLGAFGAGTVNDPNAQDPRQGAPLGPSAPGRGSGAGLAPGRASDSPGAGAIDRLLSSPRTGGIAGPSGPAQPAAAVQRFERGIAGVASQSEGTGVKVYNGKTTYNEWEFVFDYRKGTSRGPAAGRSRTQARPEGQRTNQQPDRQTSRRQRGGPVR